MAAPTCVTPLWQAVDDDDRNEENEDCFTAENPARLSAKDMVKAAADVRDAMRGLPGLCRPDTGGAEETPLGQSISDCSPWAVVPLQRAFTFHASNRSDPHGWNGEEEEAEYASADTPLASGPDSTIATHRHSGIFGTPSTVSRHDTAAEGAATTPAAPTPGCKAAHMQSTSSTATKVSSRLRVSGRGKLRTTSHRSLRRWRSASELFETSARPPPLPQREPGELRPESDASSCSESLSHSAGALDRGMAAAAASSSASSALAAAAAIPPSMPIAAARAP